MKAMFSRLTPFYLMSVNEAHDSEGFDAYPVDVPPEALLRAQHMRTIVREMQHMFENSPAPEEAVEAEAARFVELLENHSGI